MTPQILQIVSKSLYKLITLITTERILIFEILHNLLRVILRTVQLIPFHLHRIHIPLIIPIKRNNSLFREVGYFGILIDNLIGTFHQYWEPTSPEFVEVMGEVVVDLLLLLAEAQLHLADQKGAFEFEVDEEVAGAFVEFVLYADDLEVVAVLL